MSKQRLSDEKFYLAEREHDCDRLIDLIEDGTQDLDLSADMEAITLAALGILSDTIAHRIQAIDQHLEAQNNKKIDKFRRRQVR